MSSPLLVLETYRPHIFSLEIPWINFMLAPRFYGLFYVIALFFGYKILLSESKRKGLNIDADEASNLTLVLFLFGLAGGRIYEVIFEWQHYYSSQPFWKIFAIWQGGLAIHGGILGGLLGMIVYSQYNKAPLLKLLDIGVLSLILGQAIGRWGNFTNGEAAGPVTDSPLGIVFPDGSPISHYAGGQPVHPTMIYESLGNFAIFLILWNLRKLNFRPGMLTALYMLLYSVWRSLLTPLRMDNQYYTILDRPILAAYTIGAILGLIAIYMVIRGKLWRPETV